ncbi:MAG: 2-amino-4-hydroxy-6-hydroxymethyldihydropteridine diphosphokinase [bacterium]
MRQVFISVGSNVEPARNVTEALRILGRFSRVTGVSTFYETPALNRPADPSFYNGVVSIETALTPPLLNVGMLARIEQWLGRQKTNDAFAPRTIDLDMVLRRGKATGADPLFPPHPDIRDRAFVAMPLLELAGDFDFPSWGTSLCEIAASLPREDLRRLPAFTNELRHRLLNDPKKDPTPWTPQHECSHPGPRRRRPTPSAWSVPTGSGSRPAST